MDDAGKDAKALKSTAPDGLMPPSAVASVVPRGAAPLHDQSLLTTSVWCGLVFSVALVLTAINMMPPTPVGYRVSSQVIASPQRLDVLKRYLLSHSVGDVATRPDEPRLLGIKVLGNHAETNSSQHRAHHEPLMLVEVRSLWPSRTDSERVHHWLNKLSEPDQRVISQVDAANAERFARWEMQAAEHYLKHFRHTRRRYVEQDAQELADASVGGTGELVSTADGPPARFASLATTPAPEAALRASAAGSEDIEARLVQQLEQATAREQSATAAVQEQALKVSGILSLAGSARVRAQPGRTATMTVLSILVLAFAGGAIGGWTHHRAQSGGIFHAAEVARNMDVLGLPTLGVIHIASASLQTATTEVHRRVSSFRRWAMKKSLSLTEMVVLFWCMAIAIRLVLDPLWRTMLWDNPLAALGRLFIGLP